MKDNEIDKLAHDIAAEFQDKTHCFLQGSDYHMALVLLIKMHLKKYDSSNTKS